MDPDALARIGDALAAQPDRQRALELLLTEARRLTRAEAGTVYLREGDRLRFAAVQNDVLARRFGTDEARRRLPAQALAAAEPARLLRREAVAHTRLGQEIPGAGGLPEFLPRRWWQHFLHNQTALLIKGALLFRKNTVVADVPYLLKRWTHGVG